MPQPEPTLAPPPEAVPFVPDPRAELPAGAEAIVVGAGMVGASAAYHLARAGVRPLVIEANSPAWGASGRNAGMALAGLGGHFARVTSLVREAGGRSILDYRSIRAVTSVPRTRRPGSSPTAGSHAETRPGRARRTPCRVN